jgi:hypothetical protein
MEEEEAAAVAAAAAMAVVRVSLPWPVGLLKREGHIAVASPVAVAG